MLKTRMRGKAVYNICTSLS